MNQRKLGTLAVHGGEAETLAVPSVNTPVYQTTTYRFDSAAQLPDGAAKANFLGGMGWLKAKASAT